VTKLMRERLLASSMIAGLAAGIVTIAPAHAQEAQSTSSDDDQVVVVTGTLIQQPGLESASPITSVGIEEIGFQQASEVEKLMRNLPITVPGDGANVNNGTAGASTINLRGLGAQRNLILIDGKRATPYNVAGQVDVSQIPVGALERMDILTGGASAVYGSDAISGAINFVLRRDFEGVELDNEYSVTGANDGEIFNHSLLLGANLADGRGNVALAVNYTKREGVQFGDRDYGRVGVSSGSGAGLGITGAAEPTNCSGENTVPTTFGGSGTTVPARLNGIPGATGVGTGTAGLQFRDDGSLGSFCNQFNFNPYNYYQTPQERYSGMAWGHYAINDSMEAYARFSFSAIDVRQQIAPSGVFNSRILLPLSNPFLTAAARNELIARFTAGRAPGAASPTVLTARTANPGAGAWYDNNGNGIVDAADTVSVLIGRRTIEFGERSSSYDNNYFQVILGLRGSFNENWNWDVSLSEGQSDRTSVAAGYTNIENVRGAVNTVSATSCTPPTGGPVGGAAGGVQTATCVPLNLFGPAGSITPAMAGYSAAVGLEQQNYTQTIGLATVSGTVEQLKSPFADTGLSVALGAEYREENGATEPDECLKLAPASCLGGAGGNTLPVVGGFSAKEYFGELIMPLVADAPLAQSLDLELGYRYADYDPTGVNRTWKAGLSWQVNDSIRFRAMQQKAVRAPNVGELASPLTSSLDNAVRDPCSVGQPTALRTTALRALCQATGQAAGQVWNVPDIVAGQINSFSGTDLTRLPKPEDADTTTVGFVLTPTFIPVLKNPVMTLDYYKINVEGYIGTLTAQEILSLCYEQSNQQFCSQVRRLNGNLLESGSGVEAFTQNLEYALAEGVELGFNFGLDLPEGWGSLNVAYNGNVYLANESQSSLAASVIDCLGFYGNSCGNPTHEYRHVQRTTWELGDLRLSYFWRHLGETSVEEAQTAATFPAFRTIDAYNYFDLAADYSVTDNLSIAFTVNNALEEDPPIVGGDIATTSSNGGNTFPQNFDSLGRVYTVGLNLKF
jgi:iron complex outermembrane receptor protein